MADRQEFGSMQFNFSSAQPSTSRSVDSNTPFQIVVMGDFSGNGSSTLGASREGKSQLSERRVLPIDCDNFDSVMKKMNVKIVLPENETEFEFKSLDEFHPDRIYQKLLVFQELRRLRQNLNNPNTFNEAAAKIRNWGTSSDDTNRMETKVDSVQEPAESSAEDAADPLSALLQKPHPETQRSISRRTVNIDSVLQDIVSPYVVDAPDPQQSEFIAIVDRIISDQMRTILHHPTFQNMESIWRGVDFLVSRLEIDKSLKVFLIDVSKQEVVQDLANDNDVKETELYKLLVDKSRGIPGVAPWSVIVGCFDFSQTQDDLRVLKKMMRISKVSRAPFIAAANATFVGCKSMESSPDPATWNIAGDPSMTTHWEELRSLPYASYLGLAFPRFILRLPYGKATDPIDDFEFEELTQPFKHESYLWGNPAFAVTFLLADSFSQEGWNFSPIGNTEIGELPLHFFKEDGESVMQPCAEVWLTDRVSGGIKDNGLMVLLSVRNRDTVLFSGMNSIEKGGKNLSGFWSD